jgi:hypothetical protein
MEIITVRDLTQILNRYDGPATLRLQDGDMLKTLTKIKATQEFENDDKGIDRKLNAITLIVEGEEENNPITISMLQKIGDNILQYIIDNPLNETIIGE